MIRSTLLLLLLPLLFSSCGSPRSVSSFYRQHKRLDGVRNASIPGWLIYVGSGFAYDIVDDEDTQMALRFARKVKRLQFMVSEDDARIPAADIAAFTKNIRNDGFEDLILVRDGETTVNIMVKGKEDVLRHLVVLVNDESDFVFLNMRTNIRMKDLSELINHYMAREGWKEKDKKDRRRKKKKSEEKPKEEEKIVASVD